MKPIKMLLATVILASFHATDMKAQYAAPVGLIRHQPSQGTAVRTNKDTHEAEDPNAPGAPTEFSEGTIADLLERAKTEGKLLFVDCYTQWCGPCKVMARDVFPLKRVGNFLNERCICVKLDMETEEGKETGKKYDVHSYPTMLFLNGDGDLVYRLVGYRPSEDFIREATEGIRNSEFMQLRQRFQNGERDEAFLQEYLNTLRAAGMRDECRNVVDTLLTSLTVDDLLKSGFYTGLMTDNYGPDQALFREAYKRRGEFAAAYNEKLAGVMDEAWERYPARFGKRSGEQGTFDQEGMDRFIALMKECRVANNLQNAIIMNTYMSDAILTRNSDRLMELTLNFMKEATPQSSARTLLGAAYTLEETLTDSKQRTKLAKAIKKYVEKNLENRPNLFPNNHYIMNGQRYNYAEYHIRQFNEIVDKLKN